MRESQTAENGVGIVGDGEILGQITPHRLRRLLQFISDEWCGMS